MSPDEWNSLIYVCRATCVPSEANVKMYALCGSRTCARCGKSVSDAVGVNGYWATAEVTKFKIPEPYED